MKMVFSIAVAIGLSLMFTGVISHNDRFAVDKDHLKEDLQRMMPDEEFDFDSKDLMQFHYFKVHDHNKDDKLDGIEIAASLSHHEDENNMKVKTYVKDEDLEHFLKAILEMSDINDDGYIDFFEFVHGQDKLQHND